jgi:hypothetical protein
MDMFQQPNQFRNPVNLRVGRLLLQETGTYNEMQHRPFVTNLNGDSLSTLANIVDNKIPGLSLQSAAIAPIANSIIAPSAWGQGAIGIQNGWSEKRIRFMLEVVADYNLGGSNIYYIQGYTDYPGVSMSGAIDPNMTFIINSVTAVTVMQRQTHYGVEDVFRVKDNYQVLGSNSWSGAYSPGNTTVMRPTDVFTSMQTNARLGAENLLDTRLMLTATPMKSRRENVLASSYITNVINGYDSAVREVNASNTEEEVTARARFALREDDVGNNPFIKFISDLRGIGLVKNFKFGDLVTLDQNAPQVTNFMAMSSNPILNKVHSTGSTEHWNGSNRETLVATILGNSVPALMMELLISKIMFRSTNHDFTGKMNTVIMDAKSLANMDISENCINFIRRLEQEVIMDFTFNNDSTYSLEMTVDMFGETWVGLSLDGGPRIDYVIPSFCDSIITPVTTTNQDNFNQLVGDFGAIVNSVGASLNQPIKNVFELDV